jgi:hypothetical protein
MKKSIIKSLIIFSILFLAKTSSLYAQWQWLSPGYTNSANYDQSNLGVAVDPNGAVYTTGYQYDKTNSDYKIPLRKFAADGKLLYFKLQNNATGNDALEVGNDIGVNLALNKIVIGGQQHGGIPYLGFFNADNGNIALPKVAFVGPGEITKIDVRGNDVWVIGNFETSLTLASGGPTYIGNGVPYGNIFIAKYSLVTGALVSSMYIQSQYLRAYDIKIDNSNNIYFTTRAYLPVTFKDNTGTSYHTYTPTGSDALAVKLAPTFSVSWIKPLAPFSGSTNDDSRYPICLIPGSSLTMAVGGFDSNTSSYLQTRSADFGTLINQVANIPNKNIFDLGVTNCNPQNLYVVGTTKALNSAMFLEKYSVANLSNVPTNQISTPTASGKALVIDGVGRPIVTGNYTGGIFTINGQSINVANQKGTVTGLFNEPNSCCSNRGLVLDGVDDYLSANVMPLSGNPNFTFEAWVYSISTATSCPGNFRRLLGWGLNGGHRIEIGDCAGNLMVTCISSSGTATISTNTSLKGGWHHVAVSRNGSNLTAYVDGLAQIPAVSIGNLSLPLNGVFNIGQSTAAVGNNLENWKGRIDEVRLWNYPRTATSIFNKKDCTMKGNESGLILYYSLDHGFPSGQNAGSTIAWNYATSVGLYANLKNFTLSGSLSNWICSSQTGLTMAGICTPFAPEPGGDERSDEFEIQGEEPTQDIKIFPNPNPGKFTVELPEPAKPGTSFRITDLTGRLVKEQKTEPGSAQQMVSAEALPAGLYFLQVVSEGKVLAIEKFVKQ